MSQPVFAMLKGNPEFLVVRASTRGDVVVFALLVAFVVPLVVLGVEGSLGRPRDARKALHALAIWAFAFVPGSRCSGSSTRSEASRSSFRCRATWRPFCISFAALPAFLSVSVLLPVVACFRFSSPRFRSRPTTGRRTFRSKTRCRWYSWSSTSFL